MAPREDYRRLGVRQSIFPEDRRDALYELFEKYRAWLVEAHLFDLNLVAGGTTGRSSFASRRAGIGSTRR